MNLRMEVNGRILALQRTGPQDGPALIFLHHGLGAIRSWKDQIQDFVQAGYQVIAYDRWGHGDSAERQRWSMPDFEPDLADLEVILQQLGCRQVGLIGHSDGGNIAMLYAGKHPHRVNSLVVIAAHIYIEPAMSAGIESLIQEFKHDQRFQYRMRKVHGGKSEALFWGWHNSWSRPELQDWDMRAQLNHIACPTLVVQGTEDEHATEQHARDLASAIPGAELWLLPGAGHMLPQDCPREFNQHVLHFLHQIYKVPASR